LALVVAAHAPARAQEADVPYWVSLSKDETNLRVGPGRDYRIVWVYVRKGLPMKVLRVMGGWRFVEEPDGTRGWVLARFLSRTHTGMVKGAATEIRQNADGSGKVLWRAAPGVIGRLGDCDEGWCRFDIDGRAGYVRESAVWGAGQP
jgi:SH3-like domain-containing protein